MLPHSLSRTTSPLVQIMAAAFHLDNPMYDEHNPVDYVLCIDIPHIFMSSKEPWYALPQRLGSECAACLHIGSIKASVFSLNDFKINND